MGRNAKLFENMPPTVTSGTVRPVRVHHIMGWFAVGRGGGWVPGAIVGKGIDVTLGTPLDVSVVGTAGLG